jgi:hypothetical protein
MKNLLLIIALISTQCACAGQPQRAASADALLSFGDLANEITVGFEDFNAASRTNPEAELPIATP